MQAKNQVNQTYTNVAEESGRSRAAARMDIDAGVMQKLFHDQPFTVRHRLANHPLFSLPRLIELSRCLPAERVEYNAGNLPVSVDPAQTPQNGLSMEETIRRIEECCSWMALKNVELDPEYKRLLDECLNEVDLALGAPLPGACRREAFIFISSPNSVTPYHVDPEHNFLLQIRGHKTISMFDRMDRFVVSEHEMETYYLGGHRNLNYRKEYQANATEFLLRPGDGLHFPVTAPHWVQNGNEVSVSFSITFRSDYTTMRENAYRANVALRRRGFSPTPVGISPWKDASKAFVYRAWNKAGRMLGGEA